MKPNSKQKIEGKDLLKLKEKIEELEANMENSDKRVELVKQKYEATEESFREIIERANQKEENLNARIQSLKDQLEEREEKLRNKQKELEYYLGPSLESKNKQQIKGRVSHFPPGSVDKIGEEIENLKFEMGKLKAKTKNEFLTDKMEIVQINQRLDNLIENLDETIPETNKEIERLKEELKVKDKQIKITKNDLNSAIVSKDKIIDKLERDLEAKIAQINDLNNTVDALYTQINETKSIPELVNEIINIMQHKGYVTDKELEKILEKNLISPS